VWSLIVIAIAWLFYRPLLGITLLAIAGFLVWVFAFKGKDKLKELAAKRSKNMQPASQPTE
jgi:predicted alpha/beta hydrolase